ncbi:gamma-aminobutyric acid receptor subunit pi-like isoform X2 [Convolutriloba macropyga]|uniref:gamma-aminobutyric acid receptor subunit pi-like isoform X2 n=1 Tax=Convolutriloba macropyga TaxID=536237 RepID=UPI003F521576
MIIKQDSEDVSSSGRDYDYEHNTNQQSSTKEASSTSADTSALQATRDRLLRTNTLPPNPQLPVGVTIHLVLETIKTIGVNAELDFYMEYQWFDQREVKEDIFLSGRKTDTYSWLPDVYFLLARNVRYLDHTQYLLIENGSMLYDQKISLSVPCIPDPFHYPFDKVECSVIMSSYGFDESQVRIGWRDRGVSFPESYDELEYIGFTWAPEQESIVATQKSVQYGVYNYTILTSTLKFQRLYSVYLLQLFIPAAVLVVISWSTSWVNMGATPGRATIGVTTILTMLTLTTNRKQDNDSKYLNLKTSLLDIYLWVCFIYVILAFIEFSWSDYYKAGQKNYQVPVLGFKMNGKRLNVISRFLFPLTFLIFNSVFWGYVFMMVQTTYIYDY